MLGKGNMERFCCVSNSRQKIGEKGDCINWEGIIDCCLRAVRFKILCCAFLGCDVVDCSVIPYGRMLPLFGSEIL
jgi:hypothetical protein